MFKSGDRILARVLAGVEYKAVVRDVLPNGKMSIYIDDARFPHQSDYENRYKIIPAGSENVRKEMA